MQIYEILIHVTFTRVLAREDLPKEDQAILRFIQEGMPSYECFRVIEDLRSSEKSKHFASTSSKAHTYCCLKSIFENYRDKRLKFRGYSSIWPTIEYIFSLSEIGIVSRRLFCN